MTSHEKWFPYLGKSEQPGVVETGDDSPHTIEHVREVPLNHVGQKGKLMNVGTSQQSRKNSCRSDRLSTKGCRSDSHTLDASSKKNGRSLHKGAEKGGCLSSK